MIKVEQLKSVELSPISFSTVTVKDYSSFLDNTTDHYFVLGRRYLDKFYKSIEAGGYQFIKTLYTIDPSYCIDLITRKMDNTQYYVYNIPDYEYILASKEFIESYTSIIELSENKFDTVYECFSSKKTNQELLQLDKATSSGLYFKIDFKSEDITVYRVCLVNNTYLVFDKVGSFMMTDPATVTYLKDEINNVRSSNVYDKLDNVSLTWNEVIKLCKIYKIDKELFIDSATEDTLKEKEINMDTNASSVNTLEFAEVLYDHIEDVSELDYFYKRLISQDFYFSNV